MTSILRYNRAGRAALVAQVALGLLLGGATASCAPPPSERGPAAPGLRVVEALPEPLLVADSTITDTVDAGVYRRSFYITEVPWAIHVLDVDRFHCWRPVALKAGSAAIGRERTSTLVEGLGPSPDRGRAVGGVNADFFSFVPPGVPASAHVERGILITGPTPRPVLAVDSAGRVHLTTLRSSGRLIVGRDTIALARWNRPAPGGLAYFDSEWGSRTDTATGVLRLTLARRDGGLVTAIDTGPGPVAIPPEGAVLVLGRGASAARRARLLALRATIDSVRASVRIEPFHPLDAVGGSHVILRGSVVQSLVDTAGGERFGPFRHPRTAVGIGAGGRRLLLVVVDGRQPEYSVGVTLRELAEVMRDLGAEDAINLDGGGSSALAVRAAHDTIEVVSRPSDAAGERAVANALAVVGGACGR